MTAIEFYTGRVRMFKVGVFTKLGLVLGVLVALAGCHTGGEITSSPVVQNPSALVLSPIIAFPGLSPYYSSASQINLSGGCMDGYVVSLTGSLSAQQTCSNSTFSFPLTEASDGIYTFALTQSSSTSSISTPATFVWVRSSTVSPPVVSYPASSPFMSALSSLTISGSCENSATVSLTVDQLAAGSALCVNSEFSIELPEAVDNNYTINVTQTDLAGNAASTSLVWQKHALVVSPASPATLQVGVVQPLTISGGSGGYSVAQTANGSLGTLNGNTSYTVGTLANATDSLTITDSLGVTATLTIQTTAGVADHLVLAAIVPTPSPAPIITNASQAGTPGQALANAVKVQVVDRYGNGVSGYPLVFQNLIGDSMITTRPLIQTSNINGYAQVNLKLGFNSVINQILVKPSSGTLPDLAGSLNPVLVVTEESQSKNTGRLGSAFPTGNGPGPFAIGLYNADTYPDIAVLNQSSLTGGGAYVGIMLGVGNGMFNVQSLGVPLANCTGPSGIASGVFRKTSHNTDLVVVCAGTSVYEVALGNGDGTFVTPTIAEGTIVSTANYESGPSAVAVADFDGDGNLDIAIVGGNSNILGIRYGNGDGTFSATPVSLTLGQGANSIVTANLHHTAHPDIAVSNGETGTISVFFNNGLSRTFASQTPLNAGGNPTGLTTADYNNDGYPDLAVANTNDGTIDVYINDGTGNLVQTSQPTTGDGPSWLVSGDFNGDGYMDLAVTNYGDATVGIFLGNGTGNFGASSLVPTEGEPSFLGASDVAKTGQLDLVLTGLVDQVVQMIPNQGGAVFGYTAPVGAGPVAAVAVDFNNDGILDSAVVSSTSGTVTILKGQPIGFSARTDGFFLPYGTTLAAGTSPVAIATADLNVDGNADLMIVDGQPSGVLRVYLGLGTLAFQPYIDYQTGGANPTALVVGDFNADGYPDVAVVNGSSTACAGNGSVGIFINKADGTGALTLNSTVCVGQAPSAIVASDFNNDHKIDLAIANQGDSSVVVLLGNGNGTFQNYGLEYATGTGPIAIVAADFDRDGKIDVATADQTGSTVSILRGVGNGSFIAPNSFAVSTPTSLVVADFNGDLRPDLLVTSGTSNSATVLFNAANYANAFNSQTLLQTNVNTSNATIGDFNQDGAIDVIFLDATNSIVRTWMGH